MIYSMEKVLDILKGWMDKAIDFHWQKACIIALKKGHGLPFSSFSSTSCPTRDPDAMEVDFICLKKLFLANQACCMREGLCSRCHKKRHSANKCRSMLTQGGSKRKNHPQQIRTTETLSSTNFTTTTITLITPIDAYIQTSPLRAECQKTSSKP